MTLDEMLSGMFDTFDMENSKEKLIHYKSELRNISESDLKEAIIKWAQEKTYGPSPLDLREYVNHFRTTEMTIEGKKVVLIGDPDEALKVYLGGKGETNETKH